MTRTTTLGLERFYFMEHYKNLDLVPIKYFCEFDLIWKVEKWRDIINYEGIYAVSDLGRIKSFGNYKSRKEKILKQNQGIINGYLRITLNINAKSRVYLIHRLVGIAFIPNPENKSQINHKNGIKYFNYKKNLEWNTCSENRRHAYKTGLKISLKGINHPSSKLTEKEVLEIRKSNLSQYKLAEIYNVDQTLIGSIKRKEIWKHI